MNAIAHHPSPVPQGVFFHEVIGDSMVPTYLPNRDAVCCIPVDGYRCEGVYLVNRLELYRCQKEGRYVRMWRDNKLYSEYLYHIDLFNTAELALVWADMRIVNPSIYRALAQAA